MADGSTRPLLPLGNAGSHTVSCAPAWVSLAQPRLRKATSLASHGGQHLPCADGAGCQTPAFLPGSLGRTSSCRREHCFPDWGSPPSSLLTHRHKNRPLPLSSGLPGGRG